MLKGRQAQQAGGRTRRRGLSLLGRATALTGLLVVSVVALAATRASATPVLGDPNFASTSDYSSPGSAEAVESVASATCTTSALVVYVDSGSTATTLVAGIYAGTKTAPGALLAQGSVMNPVAGSWVTVPISSVDLTAGTPYWLAIMAPSGAGQLAFRDHGSGGSKTLTANQASGGTLPASWKTQQSFNEGPISVYASSSDAGPNISAVDASGTTASSATITWTTDVPSTSQVEYGTTTSYGSTTTADPTLVTSHSQTLTGLTAGKSYDFAVISANSEGQSVTSPTFNFGTLGGTLATTGSWGPVMSWPLVAVHMNVLHDGQVLLWDGWETPTPTVVWDPGSQSFTTITNPSGLFCSGVVQLADGRILVAGGHDQGDGYVESGVPDTNIFDPATDTWTRVADMHHARWYPSLTLLPDGDVLAVSGESTPNTWVDTPELYDPTANTWTELTGVDTSGVHEEEYPLSYLMPGGKVLVIATDTGHGYLIDPASDSMSDIGTVSSVRNGSTDQYAPGQILFSGGGDPAKTTDPSVATAQTLDMTAATPSWTTTAPMNAPRYDHTMVDLPDGTVFVMGGAKTVSETTTKDQLSSEIWQPSSGTWTTMASQAQGRIYHSTAALMPDGRVLVAGGGRFNNAVDHFSAQYFSPPYLFEGPRPTITSSPTTAAYGSTIQVGSPDTASIARVSLVDLATDTHTVDMSQRELDLPFTASGSTLSVQMPATADLAPPGYYMLFIVDSTGVPSVAAMVQVGGTDRPRPSATLTRPAPDATVAGHAVTLTARAASPAGVAKVQWLLDGSPLGPAETSAPYTRTWDSTTVPNGTHELTVVVTDRRGGQATAEQSTVTVANSITAGVSTAGVHAPVLWAAPAPASASGPLPVVPNAVTNDRQLVWWCSLGLVHGTLASVLAEPGPQWPPDPARRPPSRPHRSGGAPWWMLTTAVALPLRRLWP